MNDFVAAYIAYHYNFWEREDKSSIIGEVFMEGEITVNGGYPVKFLFTDKDFRVDLDTETLSLIKDKDNSILEPVFYHLKKIRYREAELETRYGTYDRAQYYNLVSVLILDEIRQNILGELDAMHLPESKLVIFSSYHSIPLSWIDSIPKSLLSRESITDLRSLLKLEELFVMLDKFPEVQDLVTFLTGWINIGVEKDVYS